ALRSAMMGELGTEGMTSQEVYDVLDLCLSCKACYSECPSSVDMAKIKAEFLYHYQQAHGTPLRSRMFGRIDRLFDSGQRFPRITNAVLGGAGRAAITQLGIHP
ncbi:MAG: FAD-binding oxidoreductase, partial [Gammaproteobacteria bacterium]|nr:FAD-binding oxidoreductase [Gammaproteobacteria bacterium]